MNEALKALNNVEEFARAMETHARKEAARLQGLLMEEADNRSGHARNLNLLIVEFKTSARAYKMMADYANSEYRRVS